MGDAAGQAGDGFVAMGVGELLLEPLALGRVAHHREHARRERVVAPQWCRRHPQLGRTVVDLGGDLLFGDVAAERLDGHAPQAVPELGRQLDAVGPEAAEHDPGGEVRVADHAAHVELEDGERRCLEQCLQALLTQRTSSYSRAFCTAADASRARSVSIASSPAVNCSLSERVTDR